MLPSFTDEGLLPPGDYELTANEIRGSFLVTGEAVTVTWDSAWRGHLVDNLEILVDQLHTVGVWDVFIDGSFVEEKGHPGDIDGYFICTLADVSSGRLQADLNALDPYDVWTWDPADKTAAPGSTKKHLPMWYRYHVEFYPHWGQSSGIPDSYGHEQTFPSAFRRTRSGAPKGIIKLK